MEATDIKGSVYVLCYEDNILDASVFKKICKDIGDDWTNYSPNYKFPKKAYFDKKDIEKGTKFLRILPPHIRNKVKLVEFKSNKFVDIDLI